MPASYHLKFLACTLMLSSLGVHAQSSQPKTRAEVQQELAEAVRLGTWVDAGTGIALREMFPHRYPPLPTMPAKTRAQVRAEYEQARRDGDLQAAGDSSLTMREMFPDRYPLPATVSGKTRAQVQAELAEAQRTGQLYADGDTDMMLKDRYPGRYPKADAP